MGELPRVDPRATDDGPRSGPRRAIAPPRTGERWALELVALRGKDVIGVRHVLDGGKVWVGDASDTLARVSIDAFGGRALVIADADGGCFRVHVPKRARARVHTTDGVPRIVAGPGEIELGRAERAVVVLGVIQVRAQVVQVDGFAKGGSTSSGALRWIALAGALYAAALAVCAALTPSTPEMLRPGALRRAATTLGDIAAAWAASPR